MELEEFEATPPSPEQMRLENELMKLRLHAEYGAIFPDPRTVDTAPGPEDTFLKQVLLLHRRLAATPPRPLKEVLDFRQVAPAESIDDDQALHAALWNALDHLEDENVIVDFDYEYPDRVMYEFITRELPELEIIGKPAPDAYICILYEAFHPNVRAELEAFSLEFFEALLGGEIQKYPALYFRKHRLPALLRENTEKALYAAIERFLNGFDAISYWEIRIENVEAAPDTKNGRASDESCAFVAGTLLYAVSLSDGSGHTIEGPFRLDLAQASRLWFIVDFRLPGFTWTSPAD
jgi:hypothetical protein